MSTGRFCRSGRHVAALRDALDASERQLERLDDWGAHLAMRLLAGARLLSAGNGGSAAEAQHLAAELVGRFVEERLPLSAIALCTDGAAVTAIGNDYGVEHLFARQVCAHGRPGDVLLVLSTSGESANVVHAAHAARDCGMTAWALTGPGPNALSDACDDAICIEGHSTATIQELHLVAVHLLCTAVDRQVTRVAGVTASGALR